MGITKDSAGVDSVIHKNGTKFLGVALVSLQAVGVCEQTDSVMFFGRFEM
jgi:hypothetical protein